MESMSYSRLAKSLGRAITVLFIVQLNISSVFAQPNLEELVRPWRFIFKGKIKTLNVSNIRKFPKNNSSAVVTVVDVLHRPGTLDNFTGRDIIVRVNRPVIIGLQAVFFTEVSHYGTTLGVLEVGRMEVKEVPPDLQKQIEEILSNLNDQALLRRIELAELIIAGKVLSSNPTSEEQKVVSEHSPIWWEAMIQIESVEKGKTTSDSVTIVFPSSNDEFWSESPKFAVGQEGVWILQRDQTEKGMPVMRILGLTALDALDFHSIEQLERIRKLIKGGE